MQLPFRNPKFNAEKPISIRDGLVAREQPRRPPLLPTTTAGRAAARQPGISLSSWRASLTPSAGPPGPGCWRKEAVASGRPYVVETLKPGQGDGGGLPLLQPAQHLRPKKPGLPHMDGDSSSGRKRP